MAWWEFNGYAFYVWGSYLVAAAAVVIESALLAARRARALRHVDETIEADQPVARHALRAGAAAGMQGTGR
jgi:heme exporter protein CcmD